MILTTPMTGMVVEPQKQGRWYTRHEDDSEAEIGYVMAWRPNALLVLAWQINGDFEFDPALITEVKLSLYPKAHNQQR